MSRLCEEGKEQVTGLAGALAFFYTGSCAECETLSL